MPKQQRKAPFKGKNKISYPEIAVEEFLPKNNNKNPDKPRTRCALLRFSQEMRDFQVPLKPLIFKNLILLGNIYALKYDLNYKISFLLINIIYFS